MRVKKRIALGWVVAALLSSPHGQASAQPWPTRPIDLVHGFAAGGNADTVARLIAAPLESALGKPVQVVARTGAGGNIATEFVARAQPDGHTLLLAVGGHAVSAALYKQLPFDPLKDFAFVSNVSVNPFIIAVRKDSETANLVDFIARAKARPGQLTFSSAGIGSTQHLTGEMLSQRAGIKLIHIPYRGGSQALTDLLGGRIDVMIDTIAAAKSALLAGQIRALAVTSPEAWPGLDGVPPVQSVIPDFSVISWIGVLAPVKTPPDVVARLNGELKKILANPEIQPRFEDMGLRVKTSSPEELQQFVAAEIARWNGIIDKAGIERQ
jgi:tripartite-type tricarboxylate transporter receptor subunit TctC